MIKKSRLLYSSPKSKSKRPRSFSDIEKLHLQKITNNSFNFSGPADVDAKKADTYAKSEANQALTSETLSNPADVVSLKEPDTECPSLKILETHSLSGITSPIKNKSSTLQILNHNFPGVTFHPEIKC